MKCICNVRSLFLLICHLMKILHLKFSAMTWKYDDWNEMRKWIILRKISRCRALFHIIIFLVDNSYWIQFKQFCRQKILTKEIIHTNTIWVIICFAMHILKLNFDIIAKTYFSEVYTRLMSINMLDLLLLNLWFYVLYMYQVWFSTVKFSH